MKNRFICAEEVAQELSVSKPYGVECSAALHHNKKMTNYHIHLVFSERKMLEHPEVKIATHSCFCGAFTCNDIVHRYIKYIENT